MLGLARDGYPKRILEGQDIAPLGEIAVHHWH
jgi:hypothetical protein